MWGKEAAEHENGERGVSPKELFPRIEGHQGRSENNRDKIGESRRKEKSWMKDPFT
jgi:hypothetical protein